MHNVKLLLVALLIATAVTPVVAQPADAPDPNAPVTEPAADAVAEPAVAESNANAGQVFEDYEASEQISEDLSVAFPVDI
jgi:hypothetical protein